MAMCGCLASFFVSCLNLGYFIILYILIGSYRALQILTNTFWNNQLRNESDVRALEISTCADLFHLPKRIKCTDHLYKWEDQGNVGHEHILLLSGFNQSTTLQYGTFVRECLDVGKHVWTLDWPGHHASHGRLGDLNGYTIENLCTLIEDALVNILLVDEKARVYVVGFSMGAMLAYLVKHGSQDWTDLVRGWILMSPVPLPVHQMMWNTLLSISPFFNRFFSKYPLWIFTNQEDKQRYDRHKLISYQLPPSFATLWQVHRLGTSMKRLLYSKSHTQKIDDKVLWIHGDEDTIMPPSSLQSLIPHLIWIPGANHSLLFGVPDSVKKETTRHIFDFMLQMSRSYIDTKIVK